MEYRSYRQSDLDRLGAVIEEATEMWRAAAKTARADEAIQGSCVLGDGIAVMVVPRGCRKPRKHLIIESAAIAHGQGSLHYERDAPRVVEWLRSRGVDCWYEFGWMD